MGSQESHADQHASAAGDHADREPIFAHHKGEDDPPPYAPHNCYYQNEVQALRLELENLDVKRKADLGRIQADARANHDRLRDAINELRHQSDLDRTAINELKKKNQMLENRAHIKHQCVQQNDASVALSHQVNDRLNQTVETLNGIHASQNQRLDKLAREVNSLQKQAQSTRTSTANTTVTSSQCPHGSRRGVCQICIMTEALEKCSHGQSRQKCFTCARIQQMEQMGACYHGRARGQCKVCVMH